MPYSRNKSTLDCRKASRRLSPISSIRWHMVASDGICLIWNALQKNPRSSSVSWMASKQHRRRRSQSAWISARCCLSTLWTGRISVNFTVKTDCRKHLPRDKQAAKGSDPAVAERILKCGICKHNVFFHAHLIALHGIKSL